VYLRFFDYLSIRCFRQ